MAPGTPERPTDTVAGAHQNQPMPNSASLKRRISLRKTINLSKKKKKGGNSRGSKETNPQLKASPYRKPQTARALPGEP